MTEKEIYIEIATRYIKSCVDQLANNIEIQEAIGFKAYHAFESIAGAFNCHISQPVPMKHEKKLNAFVDNYRHRVLTKITPTDIASLAIILNSLRNKCLYPDPSPIGLKSPKEQLTLAQARKLTTQVNGIIKQFVKAF